MKYILGNDNILALLGAVGLVRVFTPYSIATCIAGGFVTTFANQAEQMFVKGIEKWGTEFESVYENKDWCFLFL